MFLQKEKKINIVRAKVNSESKEQKLMLLNIAFAL